MKVSVETRLFLFVVLALAGITCVLSGLWSVWGYFSPYYSLDFTNWFWLVSITYLAVVLLVGVGFLFAARDAFNWVKSGQKADLKFAKIAVGLVVLVLLAVVAYGVYISLQTYTATLGVADENNNPLQGFNVTLAWYSTDAYGLIEHKEVSMLTDKNGVTTFNNLKRGYYVIDGSLERGNVSLLVRDEMQVSENLAKSMVAYQVQPAVDHAVPSEVETLQAPKAFLVSVLDEEANPLPGATVQAYACSDEECSSNTLAASAVSDVDGVAKLANLPDGKYKITVDAGTYGMTTEIVSSPDDSPVFISPAYTNLTD